MIVLRWCLVVRQCRSFRNGLRPRRIANGVSSYHPAKLVDTFNVAPAVFYYSASLVVVLCATWSIVYCICSDKMKQCLLLTIGNESL